jgi:hypothetical protein
MRLRGLDSASSGDGTRIWPLELRIWPTAVTMDAVAAAQTRSAMAGSIGLNSGLDWA